ncbi:MAG: RNA-binding transcriptional accessory protein [Anaerolineales bacterium]|nr:RNA-binding transcriptional accessory protein [Anaerolineales bacterium]
MNLLKIIAEELKLRENQVAAAVELFDDGNTLPFIARYRKERTGGLDDEQLRQLHELLTRLRALDERRNTIFTAIEKQGKLSPQLRKAIEDAQTRTQLEDLYQPYKQKRNTRAETARQKGLQGLADLILSQPVENKNPASYAAAFLAQVEDTDAALAGARDITAEAISDAADVRSRVRTKAEQWGLLQTEKSGKSDDPRGTYADYELLELRVDRLRPHQILAINRGEKQGVLKVKVDIAERDWKEPVDRVFPTDSRSPLAEHLEAAKQDAAARLLLPAIERDVRRARTEEAESHAIRVFAINLRALLLQPPLLNHTILGIDPGFRTGSKVAVVDPTGKVLDTGTIYPHEPQNQRAEALQYLSARVQRYGVTVIAIGNGTASRETEELVAELTTSFDNLAYLITSEAGASVYSASPLAAAELPDLDVSIRGAVSIARRVQDPLAELVKIDPRSIGVGLYQHDVNQAELSHMLQIVVESVVNTVGVDVNTASPALLTFVAGVGPKLAKSIVAHREEHGPFRYRSQLLDVPGLGQKTYVQAVGFLRIHGGKNPLDATAIHPESYPTAKAILAEAGVDAGVPLTERVQALQALCEGISLTELAAKFDAGEPTIADILEQLQDPGRDPRLDAPPPILRKDVLKMEDLTHGMVLQGTVRNVVDFGAFIDIGVKQDGLLHHSKMHRGQTLQVGNILSVEILDVDSTRGRISLGLAGSSGQV